MSDTSGTNSWYDNYLASQKQNVGQNSFYNQPIKTQFDPLGFQSKNLHTPIDFNSTAQNSNNDFLRSLGAEQINTYPSLNGVQPNNFLDSIDFNQYRQSNPSNTPSLTDTQMNGTTNWFTGGGSDGMGTWGKAGDMGDSLMSFFGVGDGVGDNVIDGLDPTQLQANNVDKGMFGDNVNADGSTKSGWGGDAFAIANAAFNAYMGFQQMGIAKDQLALQQDTFAFNKENILKNQEDQKNFRLNTGASIVS